MPLPRITYVIAEFPFAVDDTIPPAQKEPIKFPLWRVTELYGTDGKYIMETCYQVLED